MRLEPRRAAIPVLALPLIAGALVGACRSEAEPARNVAAVPAEPKAPLSPAEQALAMVRQRLGNAGVSFDTPRLFDSQGATVVCGRVRQSGQPEQRYIAVGEEDVFVESQMQPGHMDQAVAEFCRNA